MKRLKKTTAITATLSATALSVALVGLLGEGEEPADAAPTALAVERAEGSEPRINLRLDPPTVPAAARFPERAAANPVAVIEVPAQSTPTPRPTTDVVAATPSAPAGVELTIAATEDADAKLARAEQVLATFQRRQRQSRQYERAARRLGLEPGSPAAAGLEDLLTGGASSLDGLSELVH